MSNTIKFAKRLNQNRHLWIFCSLLCAAPGLRLIYQFHQNMLDPNPYDALMATTGFYSIVFLMVTLAITPLRRWLRFLCYVSGQTYGKRLSDWNFIIRQRRCLGLWCFIYSSAHAFCYFNFDISWHWEFLLEDLSDKPFLSTGMLALIICSLLALTSAKYFQKKMGRYWRRLHKSIYLLSVLALTHIYLSEKVGENASLLYIGITAILLGQRMVHYILPKYRNKNDTGVEVCR